MNELIGRLLNSDSGLLGLGIGVGGVGALYVIGLTTKENDRTPPLDNNEELQRWKQDRDEELNRLREQQQSQRLIIEMLRQQVEAQDKLHRLEEQNEALQIELSKQKGEDHGI